MNRNDDFETIWIEFLEGRFEELSQDELDRLLDADEATFNSQISNYQWFMQPIMHKFVDMLMKIL